MALSFLRLSQKNPQTAGHIWSWPQTQKISRWTWLEHCTAYSIKRFCPFESRVQAKPIWERFTRALQCLDFTLVTWPQHVLFWIVPLGRGLLFHVKGGFSIAIPSKVQPSTAAAAPAPVPAAILSIYYKYWHRPSMPCISPNNSWKSGREVTKAKIKEKSAAKMQLASRLSNNSWLPD